MSEYRYRHPLDYVRRRRWARPVLALDDRVTVTADRQWSGPGGAGAREGGRIRESGSDHP